MSPPPPNERAHPPNPPSYGSGRRAASYGASQSQSLRPTQYSSIGDALGGVRQPQYLSDYQQPPSAAGGSVGQHPHVASEGRYYYNPSGLPASYDYSYQPSAYDPPAPYAHSALPPMRAGPPVSPPPPPPPSSHYSQPAASYQPPYSQTSQYGSISSASHQWEDNPWHATAQTFPETVPQAFSAGRSDLTASPQADPRSYAAQQYPPTSVATRQDDRSTHAHRISPKAKGKARERDPPAPDRSPPTDLNPASLDFTKVLVSISDPFSLFRSQ